MLIVANSTHAGSRLAKNPGNQRSNMFKLFKGKGNKGVPNTEQIATPAVVHEVEGSAFSKRYVFEEPVPAETSGKNIVLRCAASYLPHPDKASRSDTKMTNEIYYVRR